VIFWKRANGSLVNAVRMRAPWIDVLCYALVALAFVADALTPQLLIVALAMNGPIALSSIALRPRLTVALVAACEVANVVAGYLNGVQSHNHWDSIAIGNRALLAASFWLVGYMTILTQRHAAEAGRMGLRRSQVVQEQSLRRAIDRVRASLSTDLVRRAIVSESYTLFEAGLMLLSTRSSVLAEPRLFRLDDEDYGKVELSTDALPAEAASVLDRLREDNDALLVVSGEVVGRYLLERWDVKSLLCARLNAPTETLLFVVPRKGADYSEESLRLFTAFVAQAGIALEQSAVFETLARQNEEIVQQRNLLAERNEVIRDIVYALAHDLRTPLAAASTTMRQALRGAYGPLPPQYQEIIEATIASNEELRHLAESLLLVARYELGDIANYEELIDAVGLCESVVTELAALASEKKVQLVMKNVAVQHNGRPPLLLGDLSELRRAVTNLIANALSATPQNGHVEIQTACTPVTCTISVRDDGYGVASERRSSLFERFAGTEAGRGTGLGLYIVRRIAERHGGSVSYAPAQEGGSIFTLALPRAKAV